MPPPKKRGTCVYCGLIGPVTSDHVPPRCLFATGSRVNLITVPACARCNSSFKLDDEYFRLIVSMRADLPEGPTAEFLRQATSRALRKPQAIRLRSSILRTVKRRPIHSSGGVYLGHAPTVTVDYRRIHATATRIIKGLFAHLFHRPLPSTHTVTVHFTELQKDETVIEDPQIKELLALLGGSGIHRTSNDVLEAWASLAEDDDCSSFWYVRLLHTIGFFAFSTPTES